MKREWLAEVELEVISVDESGDVDIDEVAHSGEDLQ
jgi:hypothetical protein